MRFRSGVSIECQKPSPSPYNHRSTPPENKVSTLLQINHLRRNNATKDACNQKVNIHTTHFIHIYNYTNWCDDGGITTTRVTIHPISNSFIHVQTINMNTPLWDIFGLGKVKDMIRDYSSKTIYMSCHIFRVALRIFRCMRSSQEQAVLTPDLPNLSH